MRVSRLRPFTPAASRPRGRLTPASATPKTLWVAPASEAAAGAALEAGVDTLLFDEADAASAAAWARLGRFRTLIVKREGGVIVEGGTPVALSVRVSSPSDVDAAAALVAAPPPDSAVGIVIDPVDGAWAIIPAENLVAAWQVARRGGGSPPPLFVAASTADTALTAASALEAGAEGILLRTGDPLAVKQTAAGLAAAAAADKLPLTAAVVTAVAAVGVSGDRVCADLTTLLAPGEGLLVGSFAGGALLIASERDDNCYVPARPFRVNAGAVHSYVATPGGRTSYLAELAAGSTVLIVSPDGATRPGVVGRAKVEARPLVRVDVRAESDGAVFSVMLQNAETVKLVAPADTAADGETADTPPPITLDDEDADTVAWAQKSDDAPPTPTPPPSPLSSADSDALSWALKAVDHPLQSEPLPPPVPTVDSPGSRDARAWVVDGGAPAPRTWRTISVADLRPGDRVFLHRAPPARHTGLQVEERVLEK